MIERVARAICKEAGKGPGGHTCIQCENGECALWPSFVNEAKAAMLAMQSMNGNRQERRRLKAQLRT